jgi:hypothetical protein
LALTGIVDEDLPETLEFAGSQGGRRLLYALPPAMELPTQCIRTANAQEPIGCLALGSHTVLPPSRHRSGGSHTWRDGHSPSERPAAVVPQWLVERLLAPVVQALPADAPSEGKQVNSGAVATDDAGDAGLVLTPRALC